jgi:chromosome segregation ATPase
MAGANFAVEEEKDETTKVIINPEPLSTLPPLRIVPVALNAPANNKAPEPNQVTTIQPATSKVKNLIQRTTQLEKEVQEIQQAQIAFSDLMQKYQEKQDAFALKVVEAEQAFNTCRAELDDVLRTEEGAKEQYNESLAMLERAKQLVAEKAERLKQVQAARCTKMAETSHLSMSACAFKVEMEKRRALSSLETANQLL